jgi:hypothetical protein
MVIETEKGLIKQHIIEKIERPNKEVVVIKEILLE